MAAALFRRKKAESAPAEQGGKQAKEKQVKKSEPLKVAKKQSQAGHKKISHKILVHPLITEKTTIQNSYNQYAFVVDGRANKIEIKQAIEETYKVRPLKVRTVNYLGKMVRGGRRGVTTRQKSWKKAIVILPPDKKIEVYEH